MLTVEDAADNIVKYDEALATSQANVGEIRGAVGGVLDSLGTIDRAIDKVVEFRNDVSSFGSDLNKLDLVLDLMDKVGPLKSVATVGKRLLSKVESVVGQIEDKLDDAVELLNDNPVKETLDRVVDSLEGVDGRLASVEAEIAEQQDAFGLVVEFAGKAAVLATEPIIAVGTLVEAPLAAVDAINAVYNNPNTPADDSVKELVNALQVATPTADFDRLIEAELAMDKVFRSLDFLRGPLDEVYKLLKPIEPILGAVGLVADLTINPVVDLILNTIGIDSLLDDAEQKILGLLPDVAVLDDFGEAYETAREAIDRFDPLNAVQSFDDDRDDPDGDGFQDDGVTPATAEVPDPFGLGQWVVEELEAKLMEVATATANGVISSKIGTISADGAGIAIELPDGVRGADDDDILKAELDVDGPGGLDPIPVEDLLLVGDRNDNEIIASGGRNVLFGAEGNDTLRGTPTDGATPDNYDIAVFSGPLRQYRFSQEYENGPIVVEHVSPIPGVSLDGRDTLINIDELVFLGAGSEASQSFTIAELFSQVASVQAGQALDRSGDTESVFLFASGASGAVTTLEGGSGDDMITGSVGDDSLIGNAGNDVFDGVTGNDTIDGGADNDTYVYYADVLAQNGNVQLDLANEIINGTGYNLRILGVTQAVLTDIENVAIEDDRQAFLFGDAEDNALGAHDKRDVLDGRAGDDTLRGGGGGDVLIGGDGIDALFGEDGNDDLIAGDVAVAGGDQFYDGGNGDGDVLHYAITFNIANQVQDTSGFINARVNQNTGAGPVRVLGDGTVERLSMDGTTVLAVDTAVNIEGYVGSDANDTLWGASEEDDPLVLLDGAGGDDVIHAFGTIGKVNALEGADTVYAGTGGAQYTGNVLATLDLSTPKNIRWLVRDTGLSNKLHAFTAKELQDITASTPADQQTFSSGRLEEFGNYIGGDYDDDFDISYNLGATIHAGAGEDTVRVGVENNSNAGQTYTVFGEDGDDVITVGYKSVVDGGRGNDEIFVSVQGGGGNATVEVQGGAGNDIVFLNAATGGATLDGGEDPLDANGDPVRDVDFISAYPDIPKSGLNIDLLNGTVTGRSGSNLSGVTIVNFEGAIGSYRDADLLGGSAQGDQLIGGGGNDTLEGRAGIRNRPDSVTYYQTGEYATALYAQESWTLEAVITTDVVSSTYQRILTKPIGGAQVFSLSVVDGEAQVRFQTSSGTTKFVQAGFVADGHSHQIAGRYDEAAGTLTLFVDGAEVASMDVAGYQPRFSTDAVTIGDFSQSYNQPFLGEIAELRYWNVARTDADLAQTFDAIADPQVEANLQLAVTFAGETPVDQSQNGFNISIVDYESGNDALYGGDGHDSLVGGDGDDFLHGGAGDDTLHGGAGTDTASYAFIAPGADRAKLEYSVHQTEVDVDLVEQRARAKSGGEGFWDTLLRIENIIGTPGDDIIYGDGQDNALDGAAGADLVDGRGGDDRISILGDDTAIGGDGEDYFFLGAGNAEIDGGGDTDTLDFSSALSVIYDPLLGLYRAEFLVDTPVWANSVAGQNNYAGTTNPRQVEGTSTFFTPMDVRETEPLFANSLDDFDREIPDDPAFEIDIIQVVTPFEGSFSDIEVFVGGLASSFVPTEGDDTLYDLSGDSTLLGLGGNDVFRPGAGADSIDGGDGIDTVDYSAARGRLHLSTTSGFFGDADGDSYTSIERLIAGDFDDQLHDGEGDETLIGGKGDDWFYYSGGVNTFDGGEGYDIVEFSNVNTGFILDLRNPAASTGAAANQTLIAIEEVWGTFGDDELIGNQDNNVLSAIFGNDTLRGLGGDDTLADGFGDNVFRGGAGRNTVDYSKVYVGDVLIDLEDNTQNAGAAAGDRMYDISDIIGTSTAINDLRGTSDDNQFSGGSAEDTLIGRGGNDTLLGSRGDDLLEGDDGNDRLEGGEDNDTLNGGRGDDRLFGEAGDDALTGNAGDDTLKGNDGDDHLEGNAGADSLVGGGGSDVLFGNGGDDTLLGQSENDTLNGHEGDDSLLGGNGDDALTGGTGMDSLDGGGGTDTAHYTGERAAYEVTWEAGTGYLITGGPDGGDRLIHVEYVQFLDGLFAIADLLHAPFNEITGSSTGNLVSGTEANDWITTLGGRDETYAGAGADNVFAGKGRDTAFGWTGNDMLDGEQGRDFLGGDDGNDRLFGRAGADSLYGGADNDYLSGGSGTDLLVGDEGNDTLLGGGQGDQLFGGLGMDSLNGGLGDDFLSGDEDGDTMRGGAGNDTLTGGSGLDVFVFGPGDGDDTITDFQDGIDSLWFEAMEASDLQIDAHIDGVLVTNPTGSVLLLGLTLEHIDFDDIVFL